MRLAELPAVLEKFKDRFPDMPSGQVESFGNGIVTLVSTIFILSAGVCVCVCVCVCVSSYRC